MIPKCEICKKEDAISIGQIDRWDENKWLLVGECEMAGNEETANRRVKYDIPFNRLNELDWIDHLQGKAFFKLEPYAKCLQRLAVFLVK